MRQSIVCILFGILLVMESQARRIGLGCYDDSTRTVDFSCNDRPAEMNKCNAMPQSMKRGVERLWISSCKVTNCSSCRVALIEFINSFENLHELNITSSELDASDLEKLEYLSELKKLSLTHGNIVKIPSDFFRKMPSLNEVDLSHNNIRSVDMFDFRDATVLKTINLSYNHLSHVRIIPSYSPGLRDVYLNGNHELRSISYPRFYKVNLKIRDKMYLCNYMWPQMRYRPINLHFGNDDIELYPDSESKCERSIDDFPSGFKRFNAYQYHSDDRADEKFINSKHSPPEYTPHTGLKPKTLTHDLRIGKTERPAQDVQSEDTILGLKYNEFWTVGIVVIVILVTLLFALIGFFIRDYRIQKDKLKTLQMRRQALYNNENFLRIKAIPNHYVVKK